jgi:hypothetical protein
MEPEASHREVSKEKATVMPVGGLRKRHRDRNLAAGRHQKLKEKTWEKCGFQKRLTIAGRGTTRHAKVARRKGNIVQRNQTRDVVLGTWKGQTLRKRQCNRGIRIETFRKTTGMEIAK